MYYDEETSSLHFIAGIVLGTVIGAGLALLTAPQSGRKTRKRLVRAVSTARDSAGGRFGELTDELQKAVRSGGRRRRGRA